MVGADHAGGYARTVCAPRTGAVRSEVFRRHWRGEKVLAEMYVQGVSTRKVRAATEELCGHGFSTVPS